MYQKTLLFGLFIFSLFLTSCEPESLPEIEQTHLSSQLELNGDDSGSEDAPIDDDKED
ncbi:hypothetical protein [Christiangramia echinicola]|uniref:Uncharacterized protein n=1 Tax=Christiangramia echinicola TaxID=279359 RepID=A0A1H1LE70_9FLAO|nr:hypothetical protein [Christiangramia echinicola]SDR72345.1 hypothetical protein SAMN04488552_0713 [Christiangramia echinicola]